MSKVLQIDYTDTPNPKYNSTFHAKRKNYLVQGIYKTTHIFLFVFIFILSPKSIFSDEEHFIEIQVNQAGRNQIISDDYVGELPYYFNGNTQVFSERKYFNFESTGVTLRLVWLSTQLTSFSKMFKDLTNISVVHIHYMFKPKNNINLSQMLEGCINLVNIWFCTDLGELPAVISTKRMFYNCVSLPSFSFRKLYFDYKSYYFDVRHDTTTNTTINRTVYEYNEFDMSQMFYNCRKLKTVDTGEGDLNYKNVSNMREMFYNCISLTSVDLQNFVSNKVIDMFKMFYNCKNLESIGGSFKKLGVSDATQMFYNCIKLKSLNFYPYYAANEINMNQMFYNCNKVETITLRIDHYYYGYKFVPIDMDFMFYNCYDLKSLTIDHMNTAKTKVMSYMFYNCKNLEYLSLLTTWTNDKVVNMRGVFQNCESIVSLDLSGFYTPKVQIMWDMFKGCSNLRNLIVSNFDTSRVTDMQSMFNGCSNLISLDISNFKTRSVQYMNKMFQNCVNLQSLNFRQITSDSLGTMHRMFYHCNNLKYLNIYSLIEDIQSIEEILEGTPTNFELCIEDERKIPNIFNILKNKVNFKRDCSKNCYGNNNRMYDSVAKQCCATSFYNGRCYAQCPGKTNKNTTESIACYDFDCDYYYSYDQHSCWNSVPDGYYENGNQTVDKCDPNCKTCIERATKCTSCDNSLNSINRFLYLSKCISSCDYSYSNENGINECFCYDRKCKYCSEESMEYGLCVTCNTGYFQKSDENFDNGFVNCYKDPEGYYFDSGIYKPCYPSCKKCDFTGNKTYHYCTSCNSKNPYPVPMEDNERYMNCYPNCTFNFYINDTYDQICLTKTGCTDVAPLYYDKTKLCDKKCNKKHKNLFRSSCFEFCPLESAQFSNATGHYCKSVCPFERPFELVKEQICVDSCTIMERYYKLCVTNYEGEKAPIVQNMLMLDVKSDIIDSFNANFITKYSNVVFDDKNIIYEITSTKCEYHDPRTTIIDLKECEPMLKEYYGIRENEPLYILKIDADVAGKEGATIEYEVYYPFNGKNLNQLDLSICEGVEITIGYPMDISGENLDLYDRNSGFYNDICYPYTNENGTDVILEDRQKEFAENNRSLCEENCEFLGNDDTTGRVECSCEIKFGLSLISEIKIDKDKLYQFMDITNIANFNVMKCIKLLFSKEGMLTNIGFYTTFPLLIAYFVCIVYFNKKEYKLIIKQIEEIVLAKKGLIRQEKKKKKKVKPHIFKTYVVDKDIKLEGNKNDNINNEIE